MADSKDRHVAYVRQVNDNLKGFVEGLARENDRLAFELTRAQQELAAAVRKARSLGEELDARKGEQDKLMRLVESITSDNTDLHAQLTEVMAQATDITNLYVSSHQIHSADSPEEVLQAVSEIVINIVGSEEFAVLERVGGNGTLARLESFGVPEEELADLSFEAGDVVGEAVTQGATYVNQGHDDEPRRFADRNVLACVPLRLGGETRGLLLIFSLLPQKPTLTQGDHELFDLLSAQAAGALHLCRAHHKASR